MPRSPRRQEAGLTYHVFSKAIRDEHIYRDDLDRLEFLRLLREVVLSRNWMCHAYCEMATHYHVLVTTADPDIATGMQDLNGRYAEYFNRRHGFGGHLFGARYGSAVVEDEGHFLTAYRYIIRNPVLAGLCKEGAEWPWSSFRATIGRAAHPDFIASERILALLSHDAERLRAFVGDAGQAEAAQAESDRLGRVPSVRGV